MAEYLIFVYPTSSASYLIHLLMILPALYGWSKSSKLIIMIIKQIIYIWHPHIELNPDKRQHYRLVHLQLPLMSQYEIEELFLTNVLRCMNIAQLYAYFLTTIWITSTVYKHSWHKKHLLISRSLRYISLRLLKLPVICLPDYNINRLQEILKSSACSVTNTSKYHQITPMCSKFVLSTCQITYTFQDCTDNW